MVSRRRPGPAPPLNGPTELCPGPAALPGEQYSPCACPLLSMAPKQSRSEERRVGKECRSRRSPYYYKKVISTPSERPAPSRGRHQAQMSLVMTPRHDWTVTATIAPH